MNWFVIGAPVLDKLLNCERVTSAHIILLRGQLPRRSSVLQALDRLDSLVLNFSTENFDPRTTLDRWVVNEAGMFFNIITKTEEVPDLGEVVELIGVDLPPQDAVRLFKTLNLFPELKIAEGLSKRIQATVAHLRELACRDEEAQLILEA